MSPWGPFPCLVPFAAPLPVNLLVDSLHFFFPTNDTSQQPAAAHLLPLARHPKPRCPFSLPSSSTYDVVCSPHEFGPTFSHHPHPRSL
ncbi:uncharacterized protein EV422DRAFT_144313 [Fimicolochytrium jonesii]|uniref:uncharacterized protein n=1 Tax=Fimicolochytrium jonesii TaxID=1396493 RepID=UPI0022FDB147|nr:uncharacterized protein EV422DRAFT_144313 [Fimicolochytrium jonesii]KAI8825865.1 hypothetical protein EV422DRAFT_144313 [Fimicolochytrium jonesii]